LEEQVAKVESRMSILGISLSSSYVSFLELQATETSLKAEIGKLKDSFSKLEASKTGMIMVVSLSVR